MKEKLLGMYFQVAERDGRRFNALLAGRGLKKKDVLGALLREYNSGTARAAAQAAQAQEGTKAA
jgi:hypothetical protein